MATLIASRSIHHQVLFFTSRGADNQSAPRLPICFATERRQAWRRGTASNALARQPCLSLNSGVGFLRRTLYTTHLKEKLWLTRKTKNLMYRKRIGPR